MHELPSSTSVAVTVPATAPFLRHLRVLAATVADGLGFDVDRIEAVRVAVDELCAVAISDAVDGATLSVLIDRTDDGLRIDGWCRPVEGEPVIDDVARRLLELGASSYDVRREGDRDVFELRAPRRRVGRNGRR